jgi:RNA polymerase sigma-B factor
MIDFLEADEESALLRSGETCDRNRVVCAHLPIAAKFARAFASTRCDEEELKAVGALALTQAAATFDPNAETRFGSYAQVAVRRSVVRYLARNEHAVLNIPERVWHQIRAARMEVAERPYTGADPASRALVALGRDALSLNIPLADGGGELLDLLPADGATDGVVLVMVESSGRAHEIADLLLELNATERRVIQLRFGVVGGRRAEGRSVAEIAGELGCSDRHVRRIVVTSLAKLRRSMRRYHVMDSDGFDSRYL